MRGDLADNKDQALVSDSEFSQLPFLWSEICQFFYIQRLLFCAFTRLFVVFYKIIGRFLTRLGVVIFPGYLFHKTQTFCNFLRRSETIGSEYHRERFSFSPFEGIYQLAWGI